MKALDIIEAISAKEIMVCNEHLLNRDYIYGFATDLMSDALALIQDNFDTTVLITGLCNDQVLRTAEMLDIEFIIFVRDKHLAEDSLPIVEEMGFNVFTTKYTMYETCGILYQKGLRGIHVDALT